MLNVPLIMVLGHGSCGAVDATISSVEGHTELPGHLPSLVKAIAPAVKAAIPDAGSLLDNAIRENVLLNVAYAEHRDADPQQGSRRQESARRRRQSTTWPRQGRPCLTARRVARSLR
jgi:carbonic anhydrase